METRRGERKRKEKAGKIAGGAMGGVRARMVQQMHSRQRGCDGQMRGRLEGVGGAGGAGVAGGEGFREEQERLQGGGGFTFTSEHRATMALIETSCPI